MTTPTLAPSGDWMRACCGTDQEHKFVQDVNMQHSVTKGWSIGHHG